MQNKKQSIVMLSSFLILTLCFQSSQVQPDILGLPDDRLIIRHFAYTLEYSEEHEQARWVAYVLTADMIDGPWERCEHFRPDPMVASGSADLSDYRGSGFDRGHLAPAGDMRWDSVAMCESFYMSNMSPQRPGFNRGIWKRLEAQVRIWADENEEIWIVTGPVLTDDLPTIGVNEVSIPDYFYKVVIDIKEPDMKGIGFVMPNQRSSKPIESFAVTIDSVEVLTGLDFFSALPDSLEHLLESSIGFIDDQED